MTVNVMRRARHFLIEALYEADTSDHDALTALHRLLSDASEEDPRLNQERPSTFAEKALLGVQELKPELDRYIQEAAGRFPVDSLAVVDRNILRLAIWELLTDTSAPVAAVVNEAVELAHRYGGEKSPAFVNGVLRTVSARIRSAPEAEGNPADQNSPLSQEN